MWELSIRKPSGSCWFLETFPTMAKALGHAKGHATVEIGSFHMARDYNSLVWVDPQTRDVFVITAMEYVES